MAEVTKMVNNRKIIGEKVVKAIEHYGPQCIPVAEQELMEGNENVARIDLQTTVDFLRRRLKVVTDEMVDADVEVETEAADDPGIRDKRDVAAAGVKLQIGSIANLISAIYGESMLKEYALASEIPAQPDLLATYAASVVKLLVSKPFTSTPVEGANALDAAALSNVLTGKNQNLINLLDSVKNEEKELSVAIKERARKIEQWQRIYSCTAAIFSSVLKLAGRDDLAAQVRPTVRKESGITDETENVETAEPAEVNS